MVEESNDIMDELRVKAAAAARKAYRGAILQPGAIGDCIVTLPLAAFMKEALGLGGLDMIGHMDYISMLSGRTCIDGVRSIDSLELHRLFTPAGQFDLTDADPLITAFSDYAWIVSFMGEPDADFEQNLIFTANCSHSAEVVTIDPKAPKDPAEPISSWFIRQFVQRCEMPIEMPPPDSTAQLIEAAHSDRRRGRELLDSLGVGPTGRIVVIHPGSGGREKCWHHDNFLSVAGELAKEGFEVVFTLGPAEQERFTDDQIRRISSAGACLRDAPLSDVLAILSGAAAFVGNDTGVTHLAAGLGVPTLALFGPTDPAVYAPIGSVVTAIPSPGPQFAESPDQKMQHQVLDAVLKSALSKD